MKRSTSDRNSIRSYSRSIGHHKLHSSKYMASFRYPKRKRTIEDTTQGPGKMLNTASASTGRAERGRRLLPAVVDELARNVPNDMWISVARSDVASEDFEHISYGQLSNAVNRAAIWLEECVPETESRVVANFGSLDVKYPILILTTLESGIVMFLPSPQNASEAQRELFKATDSSVLLYADPYCDLAKAAVDDSHIKRIAMPEQSDLLDWTQVKHVTYRKSYEEERRRLFVMLHTSGTTGAPKPVLLPHGYYAYEDLSQLSIFTDGIDLIMSTATAPGTSFLATAPMWHAGGIFFGLLKPLLNQVKTILPPVGLPIKADLVHACLSSAQACVLQIAPSVAADLVGEPRYAPALEALHRSCASNFDTHVRGVSSLLQFVSTAKKHPRLVCISTLAAVLRSKDRVPELVVDDHDAPESNGYAQSKWMGEQLVEAAAESHTLAQRPMIIRMGQIAGPLPHIEVKSGSGSIRDTKQTTPSLVLSSKVLRSLPESPGEKTKLRWIPVDVCASIVLELAGRRDEANERQSAIVYIITNMAKADAEVTWTNDILSLVKQRLYRQSQTQPVETVSLQEWVSRMLAYGPTSDNPAFKLVKFFEDLATSDEHAGLGGIIDTGKATATSQTFRELGPVKRKWREYWMNGWGF